MGKGWPDRNVGWENVLADRARILFSATAERYGLQCEWDEVAPVEVACKYPKQDNLDFDLSLWLSGDEFGCGGEYWYATIFPADDEGNWETISRIVDELVSGEARVALYRAAWRKKPYWTEVQLFNGKQWRSVSTGIGCALPPVVRPTFVQNHRPPVQGRTTLAYGTAVILLIIAISTYLILR